MVNFLDIITPEEVKEWYGRPLSEKELQLLREDSHDTNCAHLFQLYLYRGDKKTAEMYLDMIHNPVYKQSIIDGAYGIVND